MDKVKELNNFEIHDDNPALQVALQTTPANPPVFFLHFVCQFWGDSSDFIKVANPEA